MKDFNQEKDTFEDDIETNKVGDQIEEKIEKFRDQMSGADLMSVKQRDSFMGLPIEVLELPLNIHTDQVKREDLNEKPLPRIQPPKDLNSKKPFDQH